MYSLTNKFVEYCKNQLDLNESATYGYQSLSACIIDCVYSLRAKYYSVTIPVVDRYAAMFMNGNRNAPGDTISMMIEHIDGVGGPRAFADIVVKNHQKSGGKNAVAKEETCYQLAKYLQYLRIETIEDFRDFEHQELLEIVVRAVRGLGDAGVNYLFMLAGDSSRCKPDVHIHHCIRDACGCDISNDECQLLFTETVRTLNSQYPYLTVRGLDGIIWRKYQAKK